MRNENSQTEILSDRYLLRKNLIYLFVVIETGMLSTLYLSSTKVVEDLERFCAAHRRDFAQASA